VTRLLDFAKVGAHDHNVIETVPVAAVVSHVARRFQPIAEQRGLNLHVNVDAATIDGVTVQTDRHKLERIVSNLVDNAIKYTQQGGVTVDLSVSQECEGNAVSVRVSDTGIGIPVGNVAFLFDEFYQVNNHERDRNKGFGMGLAICRSLARSLGGDVRLAGTGPTGSCFELVLKGAGADRGGRPDGAPGDRTDPQAAGLCRV
jgi:signal transduction histidine kinase